MTEPLPLHREVFVKADRTHAFTVFTEEIGRWWPLGKFSLYGGGASVAFEEGDIVERSADGETSMWGTVTEWSPGSRLSFTWHPGKAAEKASVVSVSFEDRSDGTLVVLEHRGWHVFADPEAARSEYDKGWPAVLASYAETAAAEAA